MFNRDGYGFVVLIGVILAILTIIEYFMGLYHVGATLLMLVAALKAILVIYFFMHVSRLWTVEGEH
jgi:cytochrome c oxidase subunit 4